MPAVINTNLASLFAQSSLNSAQSGLSTSVQRLSSGLRINSARDDASGLAIGQQMQGHIKALDQANVNAQQAINLAQTADTSMSTVQDILLRMQQLAVTGANGSLSNTQRSAIVTELSNLNTQIVSTSTGTTYNGISILGATNTISAASTLQNGLAAGASAGITGLSLNGTAAGTYTFSATAGNINLTNGTISQTIALTDAKAAGTSQTVNFSSFGISFTIQAAGPTASAASSEAAGITGKVITVTAGGVNSLNFQVGASPTNAGDSVSIAGYNITTAAGGTSTAMTNLGTLITGGSATTQLTGMAGGSPTDAQWTTAFNALQGFAVTALSDVSAQRAVMGAKMNQLGYITQNLEAQSANEKSARSTIVDTNYSAETASLTKGQILQQAATAMLAQANQMPNVILSLLK